MKISVKTALVAVFIIIPFLISCGAKEAQTGQSPESVFNLATEAMVKGDDPVAIALYYKILSDYPYFKKYRSDIYFRLGTLLYKTERYDEAEKMFTIFSNKFKDDPRLQKVYEKLLNIYVQEFHDDNKAKNIRNLYAAKFGGTPTLQEIDNTINVLKSADSGTDSVLSMDAAEVSIIKMEKTMSVDKDLFPVCCYISASVKSPDGKFSVSRQKNRGKYYLFAGPEGEKPEKILSSAGGFAPQWSWDSRFIAFTVFDPNTKQRHIKIFDYIKKTTHDIFWAKGVSPMLVMSPDAGSSKIIFAYFDRLWIINRDGSSVSLLSKTIKAGSPEMAAWSKDGKEIIFSDNGADGAFYTCVLSRSNIETFE